MRDLPQYTFSELLLAKPAVALFKEGRDAAIRDLYCSRRPADFDEFLSAQARHRGGRIAVIIAYNEAWLIRHLAARLASFVPEFHPFVFDNSRTADARAAIARTCTEAGVAYYPLPPSPLRNINRSHGNALNWVYANVVLALEPELFVLLDHDIFPRARFDLIDRLGDQPFYGKRLDGGLGRALWAGYSVFRLSAIRDTKPDFNPDTDRRLTTGGRNFARIYRHYDAAKLRFAPSEFRMLKDDKAGIVYASEIVDDWFHIGGPAFREHKATSRAFFEPLLDNPSALDLALGA